MGHEFSRAVVVVLWLVSCGALTFFMLCYDWHLNENDLILSIWCAIEKSGICSKNKEVDHGKNATWRTNLVYRN